MKKIYAVPAPLPRSHWVRNVAWIYAGILTIMAVGQLFSFEDFIPLIEDYQLSGGHTIAVLVASVIVISEVFALPFLLRMPLSPLMRWVSLGFAVIVASIWIKLSVFALVWGDAIANSGLLGTKVDVPVGAAQLIASLVLGVLAIIAVWGLWPGSKLKK